MGDLQCPATILLVPRESIASSSALLESSHLAGVFVASADVTDGAGLARAIEDLADLHRGETIAVVATREMIRDMLGQDLGEQAIAIAVDDSGWSLRAGT